MARVPLRTQPDLPDEYKYLLSEDAMGEINLLCAMANNPDLLQSYMRYGSTIWSESGIDPDDLECCILTVARTLDAKYEWQQHVSIAEELGVSEDTVVAIGRGNYETLDDRTEALCRYSQAVATGSVTDAHFDALRTYVDQSTAVGVTLLATHYLATSRFIDALSVSIEGEFVGWDLQGPKQES